MRVGGDLQKGRGLQRAQEGAREGGVRLRGAGDLNIGSFRAAVANATWLKNP